MRDLLLSELGDLGEYVPPVEIRGGRLLGSSGWPSLLRHQRKAFPTKLQFLQHLGSRALPPAAFGPYNPTGLSPLVPAGEENPPAPFPSGGGTRRHCVPSPAECLRTAGEGRRNSSRLRGLFPPSAACSGGSGGRPVGSPPGPCSASPGVRLERSCAPSSEGGRGAGQSKPWEEEAALPRRGRLRRGGQVGWRRGPLAPEERVHWGEGSTSGRDRGSEREAALLQGGEKQSPWETF